MSIHIVVPCYKLILSDYAEGVVSTCYINHINPSRNGLVPQLPISYKTEATPSLLLPFYGPLYHFNGIFYLYTVPYGWYCVDKSLEKPQAAGWHPPQIDHLEVPCSMKLERRYPQRHQRPPDWGVSELEDKFSLEEAYVV